MGYWDCAVCGTKGILGLPKCPQCHAPNPSEAPAVPVPESGTQEETSAGVATEPQAQVEEEGSTEVPKATTEGFTNALDGTEVSYSDTPADLAEKDEDKVALEVAEAAKADEEEDKEVASSAGTSSSTSGSKPDKSGTSTGTDLQSAAPTTASPSSGDPQATQASSTAPSTGGSGQGTSSDPANPQDSSAGSTAGAAATQPGTSSKGSKSK